jgi:hypothetical protein
MSLGPPTCSASPANSAFVHEEGAGPALVGPGVAPKFAIRDSDLTRFHTLDRGRVQCSWPQGSDNLGFINICNEVKDLLFAAPPQIERIFERTKRRFQSNQNGAAATKSGLAADGSGEQVE